MRPAASKVRAHIRSLQMVSIYSITRSASLTPVALPVSAL